MLEHATYLESMALRLYHDMVQTISAFLSGTNTTKVIDLLEGTFGVDLPTRDNKDNDNEEEVVCYWWWGVAFPQDGNYHSCGCPISWLSNSPSLLTVLLLPLSSDLPPRTRAEVNDAKMRGQKLNWEFEVKPLDEVEVHFPENGISHLKTGVPKKYISQQIKQGNKGGNECHYENAPECRYPAENCGTVATHIWHAHMGICIRCCCCSKRSWSGCTWEDHFKTHHPEITGDDHYKPPLDLTKFKLEEIDATHIQ